MGRAPVSTKVFTSGNREITVEDQGGIFRVTCKTQGWKVVKTLGKRKAAAFILRCTKRLTKKQLRAPVARVRIRTLLAEDNFKLSGVEWISLSMIHGARPIILKAPKLFRQRLIHIEPDARKRGFYCLRIVDPFDEHRTEGQSITGDQARSAVRAFGPRQEPNDTNHDGRG